VRTRGLEEVERRLGSVAEILTGLGENPVALEVGCGFGHAMRDLAKACPSARLIGMNVRQYPEQLPGQEYVYGDASVALPVSDASVDLVYSIVTLYFLPDRVRFLEEAFRVLRPGGQLRVNLHRDLGEKLGEYRQPDVIEGAGPLRDHLLALPNYDIRLEQAELAEVTVLRKRAQDPPLQLGLVPIPERRFDYGTVFGEAAEGFLRNVYRAS
jgi:SAM-dependent methyltransferase